MYVYITKGVSPFLLSIEDKAVLFPGQTEFQTQNDSPFVTGIDCQCTTTVFNSIKDKVGTMEAPAFFANKAEAEAAPTERQNCYLENGSLKLLA